MTVDRKVPQDPAPEHRLVEQLRQDVLQDQEGARDGPDDAEE